MGCVYFIKCKGKDLFKIGCTNGDPERRLAELQVGNHNELVIYGTVNHHVPRKLENEIHKTLQDYHVRGEWYQVSEDIIANIIKDNNGGTLYDHLVINDGKFVYRVNDGMLMASVTELRKSGMSDFYTTSLLACSGVVINSLGEMFVPYDVLIDDWPELRPQLIAFKEEVMQTIMEMINNGHRYS